MLPYAVGYRPIGLSSTPLYVVEAIFIAWFFQGALAAEPGFARIGLVAGALTFVAVLPGLRLLRWLLPDQRRSPWVRWQPMPPWAAANSGSR